MALSDDFFLCCHRMNGQFLGQQWRPSFQTFCQCTSCSYCCVLHSASFSLAFCIWNIISTTLLICIRRRRGERPLRGEKPVSAFFPLSLFFAAAVPWQFSIRLLFRAGLSIPPPPSRMKQPQTIISSFYVSKNASTHVIFT